MIKIRIEEKPTFKILGKKTWIFGTDTHLFANFWKQSHENGLINRLKEIRQNQLGPVTKSMIFGISCVEKDPTNRNFDFYIATENDQEIEDKNLEEYTVPATKWAIFESTGDMPKALLDAEIFAFKDWLPNSNFIHANAPELEVYPPSNNENGLSTVEFWLPIKNKN
jgi:AraC family transcriptional regulator